MLQSPLTAAQAALQPCVRLAQSNAALLAEFWLARPALPLPYAEAQRRLFSGADAALSGEWPGDAFARLWRGLIDNQFRFVSDLMQVAPALLGAVATPRSDTPVLPAPR
jgi:hypothetical protein